MLRGVLYGLSALILLGSAATAEVCIDFEGSLDFGYRLGETEYVFERSGQAPGGGVGTIGSRLEFPLNCLRLGLQARWGQDHLARPWDMTFSIHTGLNDPSADMLDHDWVTWPATGFDGKFSYTESDVDMRSVELALTGRWFIANPGSFHLGPWAGLRLQYFYQDVLGFDGWQIDFTDPPFNRRNVSDPRKGIIYRVTWLQFPLGLAWRLPVGRVMSGDVHAAMVPCWFSDYDDHLLRGKDAVASGFGFGFDARSSWEVILGPTPLRLRANLGFLYLKASGDQTQTWYTDDPGTPQQDETGQISEGLPHDVKTSQFDMSLTFVYGL